MALRTCLSRAYAIKSCCELLLFVNAYFMNF